MLKSVVASKRVKICGELLAENNKDTWKKYVCPKCDGILQDAVQTSCGHWLCALCAEEIFNSKDKGTLYCPRPDCGEELTNEYGKPFFPDRFVRKEIQSFTVTCRNQKLGCDWSGKIGEFNEHLSSCEYEKQECPDCHEAFSPSEYQSHIDKCPKTLVSCPLKGNGCNETTQMSREECLEHLTSKKGLFIHFQIICQLLSLLRIKANDNSTGASGNEVKSDSGLVRQSKRYTRMDGRGHGTNDLGFLDDLVDEGVAGGASLGGAEMTEDKMMSLILTKLTNLQAEMSKKDSIILTLKDKIVQLERTLSTKLSDNEERDFRLSLMENSSFDGSMIWKIPQFSQRMEDARTGKYTSIFSLPFYSDRYGYKMCLRLYILGDGIGKGTHMSLFFVVMRGEFDNILQWPFTHKITFKLINQCGGRDVMDIYQPDPLSSSFQKPQSDMNVASGSPRFVSMNELMQGGFIVDDTIFIKVKVDTLTMRHP